MSLQTRGVAVAIANAVTVGVEGNVCVTTSLGSAAHAISTKAGKHGNATLQIDINFQKGLVTRGGFGLERKRWSVCFDKLIG